MHNEDLTPIIRIFIRASMQRCRICSHGCGFSRVQVVRRSCVYVLVSRVDLHNFL